MREETSTAYPQANPLEITGLYKKYSQKANYAVQDISFKCCNGEIVGILGPNGAGKSTILKCLTGMIPFNEGDIKICGYSIKEQPVAAKNNFSFVTDNHAVFVKMTGMQYLAFMSDIYKVPTEQRTDRIAYLEKSFQLGDSINNLISSYSHGMKQKICMMGSLMHSPMLWILDEPMVGLDPRTQNAVIAFMKNYVSIGKTILFSSHNLDVVQRICDRAIIINKGQAVADLVLADFMRDNPEGLQKYYIYEE